MKYYWLESTIKIKTAVQPCREVNTKIYVIFADFKCGVVPFGSCKPLI